jgi:hypothetical protein
MKLGRVFAAIDPCVQYLTIIAAQEVGNVATPYGEDWAPAGRAAERNQATRAMLLADELDQAAQAWARYLMKHLRKPPAWGGYPGAYLAGLTDYVAARPYAAGMLAEFANIIGKVRAAYPTGAEPPRHLPQIFCPQCDSESLYMLPPKYFRQPTSIACGCGWRTREDAQTWLHSLIVLAGQKRAAK